MPSSAESTDGGGVAADRLAATASFLAERGVIGVAWLDGELRTIDTCGVLADMLAPGVRVTDSVAALTGLEDDILALDAEPGHLVSMPSVRLPDASGPFDRVDYAVFRMTSPACFLLVVTRAASWTEVEYALTAEVRARTIAEAEVAAQARVIQRTNQELADANRDLNAFASVISHDLRAPLRGLRYAASDAEAAIAAGDAATASAHIQRTLAQARRMGAMLTGLLDYARAGRKSDVAEPIDTAALAREIAEATGAAAGFQIETLGDWPVIETAAEPLDLVLRNLIDNAIKHHDRPNGRIELGCEDRGADLAISVRDDGPGIDPAWHSAIFVPFKQIADSETEDGIGIGLALVKRTVERFGGEVSVTSDPGRARGTTFRFTWPKAMPP